MTFVQAPLEKVTEPTDDMSVEILLLAAVGITTPIIIQAGNSEMYAIPGAILAAVVALLKASHEKRNWSEKGIVVVGTTMVGGTLPPAAMHWWFPEAITKLIPQAHALLGFISGLLGWLMFWAGYLILDRRKDNVMKAAIREAERRIGISIPITPSTDQPKSPNSDA